MFLMVSCTSYYVEPNATQSIQNIFDNAERQNECQTAYWRGYQDGYNVRDKLFYKNEKVVYDINTPGKCLKFKRIDANDKRTGD